MKRYKYEPEQVVLDKHTIVEADRVRTVYNWLAWFEPEQLKAELAAAGLPAIEVYADVAGSAYDASAREFAVVGQKP